MKDKNIIFLAHKYNRSFTLGSFGRFETNNACLFRVGNERGEKFLFERDTKAVRCEMQHV